jgi:mannosyltransferase
MLVVHPHFHRRRTGVTAHTEAIVTALGAGVEARAMGSLLEALPRTSWGDVWRRAGQEDVVWHAHRNNELLAGLVLRALGRRVRVVFTRHGGTKPGWYTRWLMRGADALVTLNQELAQLTGPRTKVIGHGVDLRRFVPGDRSAALTALTLSGRVFGVVGRVRPDKGQGDFVEAIAKVPPDVVTPVLVGLTRPADEAWAAGLQQRVPTLRRVGEQRDVVPWLQACEVVVQPSHSESYSLVIPEAMACGCVVVATALPAAPGLIEHGRTGFLYPVGDVAALRELLNQLVREPRLVERVGRAAAEEAQSRFGVEHEARALSELYRVVLSERSLPPN